VRWRWLTLASASPTTTVAVSSFLLQLAEPRSRG
jgi:hypothetical protein